MKGPVFSFFFFFLCVSVSVCVVVRACVRVRACVSGSRGCVGVFVCVSPPPPPHRWVDHHRSVPYNVTSHFVPNCTLLYVCRNPVFFFRFFIFLCPALQKCGLSQSHTVGTAYLESYICSSAHLRRQLNHGCGNTP